MKFAGYKGNMKKIIFRIILPALLLISTGLSAQENNPFKVLYTGYWQQEVNYEIKVKLDDKKHYLRASESIVYTNNSPDTLHEIYFHLWPNGYKNVRTEFSKQRLREGKKDFYYSRKEERGFIDSLDFRANGESLFVDYMDRSKEIAKLKLKKPLAPKQSITITTPFRVKLPKVNSRLGHVGQSYQITQWYPKPAVYDSKGWHTFPYLDQGEFYSEFGSFDVAITLPKNYTVASTGILQNPEEHERLQKLASIKDKYSKEEYTNLMSGSTDTLKTLNYKQDRIHDFAWFADKTYMVEQSQVTLPSGRIVKTYSMYHPKSSREWVGSVKYVDSTILHYSKYVGEYPYDAASAVSGALPPSAGGMEYPMVTVIASGTGQLDRVIVHELGHNWFYGILGSNEREHPWMDEGINSFYENLYFDNKKKIEEYFISNKDHYRVSADALSLAYLYQARLRNDQAATLGANEFSSLNYGAIIYAKSALALQYLYFYLGPEQFNSVMHNYFERWKFKHPQPEDIRSIFEKATGEDLGWFFEDIIGSTKQLDYAVTDVSKKFEKDEDGNEVQKVTVRNKGEISAPVFIAGGTGNKILHYSIVSGKDKKFEVKIPAEDYDFIFINPFPFVPDVNGANNKYNLKNPSGGKFKAPALKLAFRPQNFNRTNILYLPLLGYNYQDGWMPGIGFYSEILPPRRLSYQIVPLFGLKSEQLAGMANIGYSWFPYSPNYRHHLELGGAVKQFSFDESLALGYRKIAPYFNYEFQRNTKANPFTHSISLKSNWIENISYPRGASSTLNETEKAERNDFIGNYYVNEISYKTEKAVKLKSFRSEVNLQQSASFNKASVELNLEHPSILRRQQLYLRIYAGSFIGKSSTNQRFMMPLGGTTGRYDYTYQELYFDRAAETEFWGKQIEPNAGGLRFKADSFLSNKWMVSANFSASIPRLPFHLYFDAGYYPDLNNKLQFQYTGGIALVVKKDVFEVNFPLFYSYTLREWVSPSFAKQITFRFNFKAFNPLKLSRKIDNLM